MKCSKCRGTGYVSFSNKGGVCFQCNGKGVSEQVEKAPNDIMIRNLFLYHYHDVMNKFTMEELKKNIEWAKDAVEKGKTYDQICEACRKSYNRR